MFHSGRATRTARRKLVCVSCGNSIRTGGRYVMVTPEEAGQRGPAHPGCYRDLIEGRETE